MSILAALAATTALGVIAFLAGRLTTRPTIRTLRTEISSLSDQVHTLDSLLRVAHHLAGHDRLTGLPNRSSAANTFFLRELLAQPTTVALIDLDRFKHTNDTHGHHVGDDLLRTAAERLAHTAKTHHGIAARLAGDEFVLLLPYDGGDPAAPVAAALHALSQDVILRTDDGDITVHPTASAGIAVYDGTCGTFDTMLHHADIALLHAKQQRDTHRTYRPDMRIPRNTGRHGPRHRDTRPADARPADSGGHPAEQPGRQPEDQPGGRSSGRSDGHPGEQSDSHPGEQSGGQVTA